MDAPTGSRSHTKVPVAVWIVTLLFGVMAFVSIVGSLIFAFPEGGAIAMILGPLLIVFGIAYATLAWHLRFGGRRVWTAALILPVVHTLTLNTVDLVRTGSIPTEDYPFIGISIVVVVLLLLPSMRRFFDAPTATSSS